jgi:hypothetical protein
MFKTTNRLTEKKLKRDHKEFYDEMIEFVKEEDISLSEYVWLFQNGFSKTPSCKNCETKVKFIKFSQGYRKYCSKKCAAEHTHKDDKIKESRIKKMSLCNYDKDLRNLMTEKANSTKEGFSEEKRIEINQKRSETVIEKYGVNNISKNKEINKEKSKKIKEVLSETNTIKSKKNIESLGYLVESMDKYNFHLFCNDCSKSFSITRSLFSQRNRGNIKICLNCNPNNNDSFFEMDVADFIEKNANTQVIRKCKMFKKYEMDIYLPDMNLAFECNGLWWHSEKYKEKNYHRDKSIFFEELGIKVVHVWEDDWKNKKEIVKSMIVNLISKNISINLDECIISEISLIETKNFLNENHINGHYITKYRFGLFLKENLISTISICRSNSSNSYEIKRFCNKLNYNIPASFQKLLNHLILTFNPKSLIYCTSIDWPLYESYKNIGFKEILRKNPEYSYFHKDYTLRINKSNFNKSDLIKEGFDISLTEHQIMNKLNYFRIYDSGTIVFELNINKNLNNDNK